MRICSCCDSSLLLKFGAVAVVVAVVALVFTDADRAVGQDTEKKGAKIPDPANDENFVELAPYMGELQRLTHKLSLSVNNENFQLASFYLYESLESLEDIKVDVPEYRGLPIALLVDQLATPRYEALKEALKKDEKSGKPVHSPAALAAVVESCNQCHVATQHGFIKITDPGKVNPFNQDFKP